MGSEFVQLLHEHLLNLQVRCCDQVAAAGFDEDFSLASGAFVGVEDHFAGGAGELFDCVL